MHYCKDSGNFGRNSNGKSPFRFLPTGIFGITSRGGPLISVGIFAVPFLTNRSKKLQEPFLLVGPV